LVTHLDDIRAARHWAFGPDGDPGIGVDRYELWSSIWMSKPVWGWPNAVIWTNLAAAVRARPERMEGDRSADRDPVWPCEKLPVVHDELLGGGNGRLRPRRWKKTWRGNEGN